LKFIFVFIFVASLTAGGAFGYCRHYDWIGYTIAFAVSGFIGSSIIAVLFSYLYFFQKEHIEQVSVHLDQAVNHQQEIKKIQ